MSRVVVVALRQRFSTAARDVPRDVSAAFGRPVMSDYPELPGIDVQLAPRTSLTDDRPVPSDDR